MQELFGLEAWIMHCPTLSCVLKVTFIKKESRQQGLNSRLHGQEALLSCYKQTTLKA